MKDHFTWISGESYRKLIEDLAEAGPDGRLEVRGVGKKMTFSAVGPSYSGTVNDSHACPPTCPPK